MNRMAMFAALLIVATFTNFSQAQHAGTIPWHTDYGEAWAKAQESHKLLIVSITATWCQPCRMLKQTTLTDPTLSETIKEKCVAFALDSDRDQPLVQRFGVASYPTQLFISSDGYVVGQFSGFATVEQYTTALNNALQAEEAHKLAAAGDSKSVAGNKGPLKAAVNVVKKVASVGKSKEHKAKQQLAAMPKTESDLNWMSDYADAWTASQDAGKLMVVNVSATWSSPSQNLRQSTLVDKSVTDTIKSKCIALELDADRDQRLIQRFGIQSYPTQVFISSDGHIVGTVNGYVDASQYSSALSLALGAEEERKSYAAAMKASEVEMAKRDENTATGIKK